MADEQMNVQQTEETMDTSNNAQQSNADEDDRKLFIGGLSQETKEADIKAFFEQFGEVEGVNLKTDASTGRSRGFAFVVFKDPSSCIPATEKEKVEINKKMVAVKKAQSKQGKIYVGKLKPELSDDQIKDFFSSYGAIAGVEQPFDKTKNERKNFCFITFEKEEPAKRLLKEGSVTINGHELEVKKVTPKPDPRGMGGAMPFSGGRGGRGGGNQWGGYGGGNWGGYGGYDWSGGYGGYGGGPDSYYGGGSGGWGGYGGGWGGYGGGEASGGMGGGYAGGKTPRGRGAPRGRGVGMSRGQRTKPY